MDGNTTSNESSKRKAILYRIAPGLGVLAAYQRDWLRHDLIAGVSVAAVALPTAIAYAQIIGLDPVVGLYAAIPALLAYALFGTSRHLIVNPDAATCAMIAATLTPLAAGDSEVLLSLSVVLAIFTGLFCFAASLLRLGFLADFLSRPILTGFLNGVAISIFLGQIGKVFGFPMQSHGIIASLIEFVGKAARNALADAGGRAAGDRRDAREQAVAAAMARSAVGRRGSGRRGEDRWDLKPQAWPWWAMCLPDCLACAGRRSTRNSFSRCSAVRWAWRW